MTHTTERETPIESRGLYVANSVLIICLCVPATAFGLSKVLIADSYSDSNTATTWLTFMAIPASLGCLQYVACFRRIRVAAALVSIFFCIAGGLFAAGVVMTFFTMLVFSEFASFSLILWPLVAYLFFCGWSNYRWMLRYSDEQGMTAYFGENLPIVPPGSRPNDATTLSGSQFTLRELLAATTVVAVIAGFTSYMVRGAYHYRGVKVSREQVPFELPQEASKVCFFNGSSGIVAYEFNIDEESFLRWAESASMQKLKPTDASVEKINGSLSIDRYTRFMNDFTEPNAVTIARGFSLSWAEGESVTKVAYDLDTQTAYFYHSPGD